MITLLHALRAGADPIEPFRHSVASRDPWDIMVNKQGRY